MLKLPLALAFLALSAVVALAVRTSEPANKPVRAQAGAQGLEARVAALEGELVLEKKRHDEMRTLLEQTLAYLEKQNRAAQTLLGALDESELQGFAKGENWQSRQTLLVGLRAYWGDQQTGLPKVPAQPHAKPAAPARPARPTREE